MARSACTRVPPGATPAIRPRVTRSLTRHERASQSRASASIFGSCRPSPPKADSHEPGLDTSRTLRLLPSMPCQYSGNHAVFELHWVGQNVLGCSPSTTLGHTLSTCFSPFLSAGVLTCHQPLGGMDCCKQVSARETSYEVYNCCISEFESVWTAVPLRGSKVELKKSCLSHRA